MGRPPRDGESPNENVGGLDFHMEYIIPDLQASPLHSDVCVIKSEFLYSIEIHSKKIADTKYNCINCYSFHKIPIYVSTCYSITYLFIHSRCLHFADDICELEIRLL